MSTADIVRNYFYRSFRVVRVWMLIAVVLFTLFGALDEYMMPINKLKVWMIRYVFVVPLMSICILITFLIRENKKHFQNIVLLFAAIGIIGLCMMIAVFSPSEKAYHLYFIGLLAAISWTQIIGFNSVTFVILAICITLAYNVVAIFIHGLHVLDTAEFLFNNLFFITFSAFGFYSSKIIERFIIDDYKKTNELNDEKNKLFASQNELAQINIFKSKLLSMMSHDVRGQLSDIKKMITLYSHGELPQNELKEKSKDTLSSIESLDILLDTALIWSLSHSANYVLNKQLINLSKFIDEAFQLFSFPAQRKSIALKNEIDARISILADKDALRVIVRNLIGSVIKSSSATSLVVRANTTPYNVEILVSNSYVDFELNPDMLVKERQAAMAEISLGAYGFGLKVCSELVVLHGGFLVRLQKDENIKFYFNLHLPDDENDRQGDVPV